jgi:hypothetical protein
VPPVPPFEERLLDGELGGVTAFLFFETFEAAASARSAAASLGSADGLTRIALNTRRDDGPLGPRANTLPFEAVLELSAPSLRALVTALESRGNALLAKADLAVVAREVVLWDRMPSERPSAAPADAG